MIDLESLTPIVASHDREAHVEDSKRAEEQLAQILALFPKDDWPSMALDRYALGQSTHPDNFCRWMEFASPDIGSIKGGNAKKHFIYFQAKADQWWFDPKLYDSVEGAWTAVRSGFVEALDLGGRGEFERVDTISALRSGPALVTKTLHVYFPDDLLPIFSQAHLRHFLRKLGEPRADDGTLGTVSLNRLLLRGLHESEEIVGWSTKELERLLYCSEINPFETPPFTTPIDDPGAFIRASLLGATDERLVARRESEDKARRLLDSAAGSMSEDDVRELLRLFNADFNEGKPAANRFSPGFGGHTANGLVAHLDDLNNYAAGLWQGSDDEAAAAAGALLDDRRRLPSAGSSFPSMLMYLRYPDERVVWTPSTDGGLRRLAPFIPARPPGVGGGAEYETFCTEAQRLMAAHEIPPELLDWVLSAAARFQAPTQARGPEVPPVGSVWLFQANPKVYAIDDALANRRSLDWVVRQSEKEIHAGDRVYLWRSGSDGGIVGAATVLTEPAMAAADPADPYILDAEAIGKPELRVGLRIEQVPPSAISRADVLAHPILKGLGVIAFANATNYKVTPEQDAALRLLLEGGDGYGDVVLRPATQELGDRVHLPVAWLQSEVIDLLAEKRQIVFYGPPGTGKTFVAQRIAEHLTQDGGAFELIQFHPSYSYEDFFEGYRPVEIDGGAGVTYKLTPGPLRRIVERADGDRSQPYILIVDEINRGNVPKIFGELLFLLEYRDARIALQYSAHEKFGLPMNLFVIATMNTADRSIALVDAALRRRFYFVPFMPTEEPIRSVLRSWLEASELAGEPAGLMDELNARIASEEFAIGPSYFMTRDGHAPDLDRVWKHAIIPLLEEHYFGTGRDVRTEFGLETIRKSFASEGDGVLEPPPRGSNRQRAD